jgi:hypothetical protein
MGGLESGQHVSSIENLKLCYLFVQFVPLGTLYRSSHLSIFRRASVAAKVGLKAPFISSLVSASSKAAQHGRKNVRLPSLTSYRSPFVSSPSIATMNTSFPNYGGGTGGGSAEMGDAQTQAAVKSVRLMSPRSDLDLEGGQGSYSKERGVEVFVLGLTIGRCKK